jgi:hypothetical protein
MNEKRIAELLRERLGAITGVPTIITENLAAVMQKDISYLREFVLFGETFNPTLDVGGMERQDGIYQVDICVPKGKGRPEALNIVEKVKAAFQRQPAAMMDGDLRINLEGSSTSPARTEQDHFVYSLSIRWTVVS